MLGAPVSSCRIQVLVSREALAGQRLNHHLQHQQQQLPFVLECKGMELQSGARQTGTLLPRRTQLSKVIPGFSGWATRSPWE